MFLLASVELRAVDDRALEELLARAEMTVAAGAAAEAGEIRGPAAAALLFADYAVLDAGATLHLDVAEAWAAAAWRLGHGALRLYIEKRTTFSAAEAKRAGLCDEVIEGDPQEWLDRWMAGRSAVALDSAAMLIRTRGGDALERAEFARLFATGEPQRGLTAFLNRRSPRT